MAFFGSTALTFFIAQAALVSTNAATGKHQEKYDLIDHIKSTNGFNDLTYKVFESIKKEKAAVDNKEEEDGADDTSLRHLAGGISKAKKWKMKYEQCVAELEEPSYLYVQMADKCTLRKKSNGKYTLTSPDIAPTTWRFADKPLRTEDEMDTKSFIQSFDDLFPDSAPNAAITFVHKDDDMFDGPLVTAFVEAAKERKDGNMVVTYTLSQSKEQASVYDLDDFFEGEDKVTYKDCSIFIDSSSVVSCGGTSHASSCSNCPKNKCSVSCESLLGCSGGNEVCCKTACDRMNTYGLCNALAGCEWRVGCSSNCCQATSQCSALTFMGQGTCDSTPGCVWQGIFDKSCTGCAPTGYECAQKQ